MGGPPVNSLILQPYFLGGPETLVAQFEGLRACGVGVVDMVFLGHHDQQTHAMSLFAERVMPVIQSWDDVHFDEVAPALVNVA